jgi:hypothetical protein
MGELDEFCDLLSGQIPVDGQLDIKVLAKSMLGACKHGALLAEMRNDPYSLILQRKSFLCRNLRHL